MPRYGNTLVTFITVIPYFSTNNILKVSVKRGRYGWLEAAATKLAGLRSAQEEYEAQSVMTFGGHLMPKWSAGNWDF